MDSKNTDSNQMDSKAFAIGVLSVTAVIFLAALIVLHAAPDRAVASNVGGVAGDFTVVNGRVANDEELLYVMDNTSQRLLVYGFNRRSGASIITDKAELSPAMMRGRK